MVVKLKRKDNKIAAIIAVSLLVTMGATALFGGEEREADETPTHSVGSTDFTGFIPVSSVTDLARVGTGQSYAGHIWSLSASYYLTNDIFFGIQDTNGGNVMNISLTRSGTDLTLNLGAGITGTAFLTRSDAAVTPYPATPITNGSATFSNVATGGTFILTVGGPSGGGFAYSCAITISSTAAVIISDGTPASSKTFNSNGNFNPIGNSIDNRFSGVFDGNGYTIDGLKTAVFRTGTVTEGQIRTGMFGIIAGAEITNISLVNGYSVGVSETGFAIVGGIIGTAGIITLPGNTLSNLSNANLVSAATSATQTGQSATAGGIAGTLEDTPTTLSQNSGFVSAIGATTNGTVGGIHGNATHSPISTSFNTGSISASGTLPVAGGIVGSPGGHTNNTFNTGSVTASFSNAHQRVGGITAGPGLVTNSYNTGPISTLTSVTIGGIIGQVVSGSVITNCYVLDTLSIPITTAGSANIQGGGIKTSSELRTQSTFVGWDFANTWMMHPGVNDGFPVLRELTGQLEITSAPLVSAVAGQMWSYTPQASEIGAQITVSGAPWLSVSGGTIIGMPPAPSNGVSQTHSISVTATKAGFIPTTQTFTLTVFAQLTFTTIPTASLTVTPLGGHTFGFDMSGSTEFSNTFVDFGDGNTASGILSVNHTYERSGIFVATGIAANPLGSAIVTQTVIVVDDGPVTAAFFNQPYTYVIPVTVGGNTPFLSGALWLTVTEIGPDFVIVSGVPSSISFVGQTYNMSLTVGTQVIEWPITVFGGASFPVAGFNVTVDGLTVTITPTALNATLISYDMGDGSDPISSMVTVIHTYGAPGTFSIAQTVSRSIDGMVVVQEFLRTVTVTEQKDDNDSGGLLQSDSALLPVFIILTTVLIVFIIITVAIFLKSGTIHKLLGLATVALFLIVIALSRVI